MTTRTSNLGKNVLLLMAYNEVKNVSELSKQTSIPFTTLTKIVKGESSSPQVQTVMRLANFFGVNVEEIIGQLPDMELNGPRPSSKQLKPHLIHVPIIEINDLLDLIQQGQLASESDTSPILYEAQPGTLVFAIKTQLNMSPTFPENGMLIFEKSKQARDGDFVIAQIDQGLVIRQLICDGSIKTLQSFNTDTPSQPLTQNHTLLAVAKEYRKCL